MRDGTRQSWVCGAEWATPAFELACTDAWVFAFQNLSIRVKKRKSSYLSCCLLHWASQVRRGWLKQINDHLTRQARAKWSSLLSVAVPTLCECEKEAKASSKPSPLRDTSGTAASQLRFPRKPTQHPMSMRLPTHPSIIR